VEYYLHFGGDDSDDEADDVRDHEDDGLMRAVQAMEVNGALEGAEGAAGGTAGEGRSPLRKLARTMDNGGAQEGVGAAAAATRARLSVAEMIRKRREGEGVPEGTSVSFRCCALFLTSPPACSTTGALRWRPRTLCRPWATGGYGGTTRRGTAGTTVTYRCRTPFLTSFPASSSPRFLP
jgi:hypothetical protein